jgi:hypothetical protein
MPKIIALTIVITLGLADSAFAAVCRDLHAQFVPCPKVEEPLLCRDAKTKQPAKCSAPGTEPIPAAIRHFNG